MRMWSIRINPITSSAATKRGRFCIFAGRAGLEEQKRPAIGAFTTTFETAAFGEQTVPAREIADLAEAETIMRT
ncbi:hypothetical protein D3C78_1856190 [compost metagenome]